MFFNRYLFAVFLISAAGGLSLYVVFTRLNPFDTPGLSLLLFFISFFILSGSLSTLLGYYVRIALFRHEVFLNHFNVSLRQGLLVAFCLCGLLGLQIMRTLGFLSGFFLVLLTVLLEVYFVARE
jgi:hypothetical protein